MKITISTRLKTRNSTTLRRAALGLMQVMELVTKFLQVVMIVMDLMAEVLPGPLADKVKEVKEDLLGTQDSLDGVSVTDFPPLGQLQQILVIIRNILIFIEQAGKAVLGQSFEMPELVIAELTNP